MFAHPDGIVLRQSPDTTRYAIVDMVRREAAVADSRQRLDEASGDAGPWWTDYILACRDKSRVAII